ncbi:MAG: phosphatidylserine decarboxylase family protein [Planctomycetota bacterium]
MGIAIASLLGLCAIFRAAGPAWLSIFPAILFAFVLYFFRNPARTPPDVPAALVSPADGRVTHIEVVEEPDFIGGPALKIGIFLSLFDVHLNRAPSSGTVRYLRYRRGKFHDARSEASSAENESNAIGIETDHPNAARVLVKQIAGVIARRIVCDCREGDALKTGELIGMIKFGSRTELYLPAEASLSLRVAVGDPVRAGTTVLGVLA